jgi:hypothetical protein
VIASTVQQTFNQGGGSGEIREIHWYIPPPVGTLQAEAGKWQAINIDQTLINARTSVAIVQRR